MVSPRDSSTAVAPGLAPAEIGRRWSNKNKEAAEDVGLVVKRSSGLALTNRRLLMLDLAITLTGGIKEVKGMLSEVPLDQIDEIKRVSGMCSRSAQVEPSSSSSASLPRQRRWPRPSPPRRRIRHFLALRKRNGVP